MLAPLVKLLVNVELPVLVPFLAMLSVDELLVTALEAVTIVLLMISDPLFTAIVLMFGVTAL